MKHYHNSNSFKTFKHVSVTTKWGKKKRELNNFSHIVTIPTPETVIYRHCILAFIMHYTSGRGLWLIQNGCTGNNMEKHLGNNGFCSLG